MDIFNKSQFEELAEIQDKYCISIYIPTQRIGENKDSLIRLKNHVAKVENELRELGLKPKEVEEYVKPLKDLVGDTNLWRHLSDALVLFRSQNRFEYHCLPLKVDDFSHVSDRFYLLPLINIFNNNRRFFILLLSLNKNKLYEADMQDVREIDTFDVFPDNIYDSAGHDVVQKSLEFRSRMPGKEFAPFHGKGEGKDYKETEVLKYMEDIDRALRNTLEGYNIPVVVASVESIFSQLKEASSFKHLYPKCVTGNYDNEDILKVHEKAKDLLKPYFEQMKNEKKDSFSEAVGKVTSSMEDIVVAADTGRIDTLFVARGEHMWGEYKRDKAKIDVHPERKPMDNCLIDFAARNAFLKSGHVFIEEQDELPEGKAPVNAIMRF